jgi:hypothetical protein
MLSDGGQELLRLSAGHASAGLLMGLRSMGLRGDWPGACSAVSLACQKGWSAGLEFMLDWGFDPRPALASEPRLWKVSPSMEKVVSRMAALAVAMDEKDALGEASGSETSSAGGASKRI